MSTLQLTYEYQGRERVLNKHPVILRKLRDGIITETDARNTAWFIRDRAVGKHNLGIDDAAAIVKAKAILKGQRDQPTEWKEFQDEKKARLGITFQTLANEWTKLKMPDASGRVRDDAARDNLLPFLSYALVWWGDKPVEATTRKQMLEFAGYCRLRAKENGRGNGERTADLQLSALSSLCQWAAALEKISKNPFADRPRIQSAKTVKHCHLFMPDSDEEMHTILKWFFTTVTTPRLNREGNPIPIVNGVTAEDCDFRRRSIGAWLCFTALSGLRPEEPQYLFRFKRLTEMPPAPQKLPAGTIFPTRDGKLKMRVIRTKHGQNPYILLHPALLEFLAAWESYLDQNADSTKPTVARALFPHHSDRSKPICSGDDFSDLNHQLDAACSELKLEKRRPKGFGRAYYVRVRRSQGQEDPLIAFELGQTTNGKLIRDTYGEPDDMLGGLTFDWQPEEKGKPLAPAWSLLLQVQTERKIIHGNF